MKYKLNVNYIIKYYSWTLQWVNNNSPVEEQNSKLCNIQRIGISNANYPNRGACKFSLGSKSRKSNSWKAISSFKQSGKINKHCWSSQSLAESGFDVGKVARCPARTHFPWGSELSFPRNFRIAQTPTSQHHCSILSSVPKNPQLGRGRVVKFPNAPCRGFSFALMKNAIAGLVSRHR